MCSCARSRRGLTEGLEDEIPDLEERVDHILTEAGLRHRHHAAHQPDRAPQRLLLQVGQRQALHRQVASTTEDGNIWFERWSTPGSAAPSGSTPPTPRATRSRSSPTASASTAAPARRPSTAARAWRPTPTPSSTPTTSRLGSPSCSETTCSSTSSSATRRTSWTDGGGGIERRLRSTTTSWSRRRSSSPRYLRWSFRPVGSLAAEGLDEFREAMLSDRRIRVARRLPESRDVFPGVDIKGGVCYFLWDRDNTGECRRHHALRAATHRRRVARYLMRSRRLRSRQRGGLDPREGAGRSRGERIRTSLADRRRRFSRSAPDQLLGLATTSRARRALELHARSIEAAGTAATSSGRRSPTNTAADRQVEGLHRRSAVRARRAWHLPAQRPQDPIIVAGPGTVCTETYLVVGPFESRSEAENCRDLPADPVRSLPGVAAQDHPGHATARRLLIRSRAGLDQRVDGRGRSTRSTASPRTRSRSSSRSIRPMELAARQLTDD